MLFSEMETKVKILYTLTRCLLAASLCASVLAAGDVYAQERGGAVVSPEEKGDDSVNTPWSLYSFGLYYKYNAIQSADRDPRNRDLDLALDYFNRSLKGSRDPGSVYDQISDCYWYREEYDLSAQYARKSIEEKGKSIQPYMRLYRIQVAKNEYVKAAETLEEYSASFPKSLQAKYELGEHYFNRMKDMKSAQKSFTGVLELTRNVPSQEYYRKNSFIYLGFIAYRQRKYGTSLRNFQRAFEMDNDDLEALFFLSQLNMMLYRIDDAEKYSEMYLLRNAENQQVHSMIGKIRYMKEDPRAIYHLGRVKDVQNIEGMIASGLYYERLGDDGQALPLLNLALKYQPGDIPVRLALARVSLRKKDAEEAFKQYTAAGVLMFKAGLHALAVKNLERADSINRGVPEVLYYLGRAEEKAGNYAAAIRYYKKVNDAARNSNIELHVGYLYGVLKEYDAAMGQFNAVISREPKNPQAYFFSGLVSIWSENYRAAERDLKRAISLENDHEPYYFYLAVTMEKTRRINKAIDYLNLAIKHDDKSARSYNYLGYLYADNGLKLDRSLELINRALELEPGNGAYVDSLGWAHYKKGNYRLALEKLLLAEKLLKKAQSPDPVVYDHIGDTYFRMGERVMAIRYWNKSIDLEKNGDIERKIRNLQKQMKKE